MINNSESFEEIEARFWKNSDKIDKLEVGCPERLELLEENNKLLDKIK